MFHVEIVRKRILSGIHPGSAMYCTERMRDTTDYVVMILAVGVGFEPTDP